MRAAATSLAAVLLPLLLYPLPATAEASPSTTRVSDEPVVIAQQQRKRRTIFRRPGTRDEADEEAAKEARETEPAEPGVATTDGGDAEALDESTPFDATRTQRTELPAGGIDYEMIAVPDRWRIVEGLGVEERWWDPYNQSTLKGDRPIFETQDWFVNLSAIFDSVFEARSSPTPFGVQLTRKPGTNDIEGDDDQLFLSETLFGSVSLFKGDTAFRPPEFELRVSAAVNWNYAKVQNRGVLYADPRKGRTRTDWHFAFTELFVDKHLYDWNDRYDFVSARAGVQAFTSDFRGFLYQDNNLGMRIFGNAANNRVQYNLAYFRRIDKEPNSGLPQLLDLRDDDVFFANLYYQDFPIPGFTLQGTAVYNRNTETNNAFANGFRTRPSPAGNARAHEYDVVYLGLNGDGHIDRLNWTFSLYYATGHDDQSLLAQRGQTIDAWFFASEVSWDFDWWRLKGFGLFASGDDNPFDGWAKGFDAIADNANFAGASSSYWHRQAVPLIFGGGVELSGRDSLLPSLRTLRGIGQSNFVNPGLGMVGLGADFELLPELTLIANGSYLRFHTTEVLEELRQQRSIDEEIGWDLSAGLIYRPLMTNNIVLRGSGAVLFPGEGLKDLYRNDSNDPLYSVLLTATLAY
jgi:hypothetical protein